jgi:branched-chain amino acid transport system permease protein
LINGLSVGSMYALIAIGYTLGLWRPAVHQFRALRRVHGRRVRGLLHGQEFQPARPIGGGILVMIVAMLACAALGIVIELLAYRPLRRRSRLTVLITAIGVSLFLENAGTDGFWCRDPKPFPKFFPPVNFALRPAGALIQQGHRGFRRHGCISPRAEVHRATHEDGHWPCAPSHSIPKPLRSWA